LAIGNLSSQLEYAGWDLVFGGEGGGIELDYGIVLALVEGIVDI